MGAAGVIEERASFAGTSTRVLRVDGPGPPLVLLHGYSDSADCWRGLFEALGDRRAAVAVDLPGFGKSDGVPAGRYLPRMDAFVAEVVRAHGTDGPVLLAGNSLGAVAALRAAHDASLPLAGIVPIAPAGLGHAPWVDLLAREPLLHRIAALPFPLPRRVIRSALMIAMRRLAFGDPRRADPGGLALFAGHHPTSAHVRRLIAGARSLMAELREGYPALESIACPVLLLWGTRDILVPLSGAQVVLDAVPDARIERLAGVGHCAHAEVPHDVARLLLDFDAQCRQHLEMQEASA